MSTRFEKMMRIPNALLRVLGLGVCTWRCVHKYPKLFKCPKENEVSICDPCMEDCVYWGDVPVPKSEEAYEIWYDQMGYADSEETGPSYEEWLIHKAK